jgi:transposase
MTMLGVAHIILTATVSAIGDGRTFERGRNFAAWLGLVPRQISTGDRTILDKISKRGNRYLRTLYYAYPEALGAKATVFNFSIAYGLVIAVSALPVLAVILRGLDITRRRIGAVALGSASIADIMMWLELVS